MSVCALVIIALGSQMQEDPEFKDTIKPGLILNSIVNTQINNRNLLAW